MQLLNSKINQFVNGVKEGKFNSVGFSDIDGMIADLSFAISDARKNGTENDEIHSSLSEIRNLHAKSPFINRVQNWPRGYQGDFETIEYICESANKVQGNSFEYVLEDYALNSAISQQHRNKIKIQEGLLLEQLKSKSNPKILIIGCGSGRDIRNIQDVIAASDAEIYLNDMDENALNFTKGKLSAGALSKMHFVNKNVVELVKSKKYNKIQFDLILFGGVFDYLSEKVIKLLLRHMYKNMLSAQGKLLFTNIKEGNPFKDWMEYLGNWTLIERSESECMRYCLESNIPERDVHIYQEQTGLTLIVEIQKSLLN